MKYFDKTVSFDEDHNNGKYDTLIIGHHQVIPEAWLDELAERKKATTAPGFRAGDFEEFACIPVVIIEKWKREGFDIEHEHAEAIVRRLKTESLDAFLTTSRQVY